MRTIKFRGLGVNEIWRHGYYFAVHETIQTYHYIRDRSDYRIHNPETIGQFTGLKDKEGKDCYEGDIVINNLTGHKGTVKFSDEFAVFSVHQNGKWVCSMGAMSGDGFSILDNIFQNPKLL